MPASNNQNATVANGPDLTVPRYLFLTGVGGGQRVLAIGPNLEIIATGVSIEQLQWLLGVATVQSLLDLLIGVTVPVQTQLDAKLNKENSFLHSTDSPDQFHPIFKNVDGSMKLSVDNDASPGLNWDGGDILINSGGLRASGAGNFLGDVSAVTFNRVKTYRALLTQAGTAAPTATVLENTLGGTLVWTRTGVGLYSATLAGVFAANKTQIFIGSSGISGTSFAFGKTTVSDVNHCTLVTTDVDLSGPQAIPADSLITKTEIRITVTP